jgi:hypothetical protein
MATKYILATLSLVFLAAGLARRARERPGPGGQSRTWLTVGTTFAAVAAWLWLLE